MHHYRFHRAVATVYALTAILAVLFVRAGVQSVAGAARFPDHLLFELIGAICLCWVATGPRELVVLRKFIRSTRQKAALAYSYTGRFLISVRRAARSLAALFILPSHKIQTEP